MLQNLISKFIFAIICRGSVDGFPEKIQKVSETHPSNELNKLAAVTLLRIHVLNTAKRHQVQKKIQIKTRFASFQLAVKPKQ